MFMHFTVHEIKAHKVQDHPFDPLNRRVELYQTWHLSEIDPLVPLADRPASSWSRLGFSTRGGPDDGVSFREGEARTVVDPQIIFGLPDDAFASGKRTRFVIDYHHWESDGSTAKVRAAFSNSTLAYLLKVWKESHADQAASRARLEGWLKDNWQQVLKGAIAAAGMASSPWVAVGTSILPVVELLVDVAKNNSDEYLDMHRFVVELNGEGAPGQTRWRVVPPSGEAPDWVTGQGKQEFVARAADAGGHNKFDVRYAFRMID
ncbi:hypothetical protein BE20_09590 [Sorangium cellulosum]|uniref:Uncharacterized protein n=1 Tax=Sorangium cellulosum TaxID=56 RepID=A0A150S114_SORCE|nr:hypothetical protein BE18_15960 [Sorangium cellulosum]KYF93328.1 hypothetical protein BE20_09590 [Sorangium cellulosum]